MMISVSSSPISILSFGRRSMDKQSKVENVFFSGFAFFFFNDTATTEIDTLSLHDALPILPMNVTSCAPSTPRTDSRRTESHRQDQKSTRLNSSHVRISYAVFCLKKKK